jgi:hypothetical protein
MVDPGQQAAACLPTVARSGGAPVAVKRDLSDVLCESGDRRGSSGPGQPSMTKQKIKFSGVNRPVPPGLRVLLARCGIDSLGCCPTTRFRTR